MLQTVEVRALINTIDELTALIVTMEEVIEDAVHRGDFTAYCVGDDDGGGCGVGAGVGGADGGGDRESAGAVAAGVIGGNAGSDGVDRSRSGIGTE